MLKMNLYLLRLVLVPYSQLVEQQKQLPLLSLLSVYSVYLDLLHTLEQDLSSAVVLYSLSTVLQNLQLGIITRPLLLSSRLPITATSLVHHLQVLITLILVSSHETTTDGEFNYGTVVTYSIPTNRIWCCKWRLYREECCTRNWWRHAQHILWSSSGRESYIRGRSNNSIRCCWCQIREREILLVLDLSSHSMVVPRQLLGIATKIPSTYSAAKTMVLSLLLQRSGRQRSHHRSSYCW